MCTAYYTNYRVREAVCFDLNGISISVHWLVELTEQLRTGCKVRLSSFTAEQMGESQLQRSPSITR